MLHSDAAVCIDFVFLFNNVIMQFSSGETSAICYMLYALYACDLLLSMEVKTRANTTAIIIGFSLVKNRVRILLINKCSIHKYVFMCCVVYANVCVYVCVRM